MIRWSEPAAEALESIYKYIARDKPEAAIATVQKLLEVVDRLEDFPQMGRRGALDTREIVASPFVIVYRIVGDVISVEAVFHGSRR